MPLQPRDRLIVALDVSTVEEAQAMVARLGDAVSFYKIGYQLALAGGLSYAAALIDSGKQLFVDMKLHDIGNTVARGRVTKTAVAVDRTCDMGSTHVGNNVLT